MHQNIAIITFIASANALTLESKLQAGFIDLGGLGDDILGLGDDILGMGEDIIVGGINYGTTVGTNLLNSGLALGDYVVSGDVLEDIEYVFSADFGEDLLDVGDAIVTGDLFVDGYEWATDGDSWGALGKVALATGYSLATGDVEQAWNIATNVNLYDPDYPEKEMKKAYKKYEQDYERQVGPQIRQLEEMQANKAATCSTIEPGVGEKVYPVYGAKVNYSQYIGAKYGVLYMSKFYQYYQGSPTQEECEGADCLHPCYGASHETNCNTCLLYAFDRTVRESMTEEQAMGFCGACSVPPKEVEIPPKMTYEQFKKAVKNNK